MKIRESILLIRLVNQVAHFICAVCLYYKKVKYTAMKKINASQSFTYTLAVTLKLFQTSALASLVFVSGMSSVHARLPVVHPTMPWSNNVQITEQTGNFLQIGQNEGRAGNWVLNWQSFDIDEGSRVQFVQPSATHIALNRIYQNSPSEILGSLDANGRIYLINQNGITFGKNSSINVNSMVASSLALNIKNDSDFINGKLNISNLVNDAQAAFDIGAFKYAYEYQGNVLKEVVDVVTDPDTQISRDALQQNEGKIKIEKGFVTDAEDNYVLDEAGKPIPVQANIQAQEGGSIIVIAPSIENAGDLNTESGQVILAAAEDKVYLTPSQDPALRGFLVEVKTGGSIENLGSILAERGNITLAGLSINQNGVLHATTSVSENGSIRLLARQGARSVSPSQVNKLNLGIDLDADNTTKLNNYIVAGETGDVTLQQGSSTLVTIDTTDETEITDLQSMQASRVEVTGKEITVKSGAVIVAQGGRVVNEKDGVRTQVTGSEVLLHATENALETATTKAGDLGESDSSKIIIESGSKIDVSGNNEAQIAMQRNELELSLTGNFLRDAPLQRDGVGRNESVTVDIRDGTPLGDISDLTSSTIKRGIKELSAAGGSINIISRGGVLLEENSELDITGGSIAYLEGFINSSMLITDTGRVIDIADADPNLLYSSIYGKLVVDSERWGKAARKEWSIFGGSRNGRKRFYNGYTEGKDAGRVKIKAHAAIIDSTLTAGSVNGAGQREHSQRASAGELSIELGGSNDTQGQSIILSDNSLKDVETQQNIKNYFTSADFDAVEAGKTWQLDLENALISDSGISKLTLSTAGDIVVNETANLNLTDGGGLTLSGGAVEINNYIRIASGEVEVTAVNGDLLVNGIIDTSGSWVNDTEFVPERDLTRAVNLNGGSIELALKGISGELLLADSILKANGGAWLKANGEMLVGEGGRIKMAVSDNNNNATNIELGEFEAYSAARGGSLSISANKLSIASAFNVSDINTSAADIGELQFTPEFFTRGGFSDYELISNADDITIYENTIISPTTDSYVFNNDINLQKSADSLSSIAEIKRLDAYAAPTTHLTLGANQKGPNERGQGLLISDTAIINMTAGSNLNLTAVNNLIMKGDIYTAGGDVSLSLNAATATGYSDNAGIWFDGAIKTNGNLNEQGEFTVNTFLKNVSNDQGLITGRVLAAGDVNFNANSGYIITTENSEINTSGSEYDLDLPVEVVDNTVVEYQRQAVSSNAGNINFTTAEGMYLQGNLQAQAANVDGASGGKLSVEFDLGKRNSDPDKITSDGREIHIRQLLDDLPDDFFVIQNADASLQNSIVTDINDEHIGKAWLSVETIKNSGVDRLRLQSTNIGNGKLTAKNTGAIIFDDNVDLQLSQSLELIAPIIRAQNAPSIENSPIQNQVNLSAAYVLAGSIENSAPHKDVVASAGNASLNITAGLNGNKGLLEITGDLYFQGIAESYLSSAGDIRFRGVKATGNSTQLLGGLNSVSDITLQADQIYTSTLSQFGVTISDNESALLKIIGNDIGVSPILSAGSVLDLTAPIIQQNGVVKAPQGEINFNADRQLSFGEQSVTSVSGEEQLVPYGETSGEESWIYPVSNDANSLNFIASSPNKEINIQSDDIKISDSAVFDVSGGGDLTSWEFVPGLGGSVDTLLTENANGAFAVIPANPTYAPYDYINWLGEENVSMGDQVYLAGKSDLAEGLYTILPARYALLPGAHLITPTGETQLLSQQFSRLDGTPIVPGQFRVAGTEAHDNLWSGFVVETSNQVRQRSEYFETTASQFFREDSLRNNTPLPFMPEDAGSLSILAGSALDLSGILRGSAATTEFKQGNDIFSVQGRGSQLNISGNNLRVVSQANNEANNVTAGDVNGEAVIEIVDSQLNAFGADSILLGGNRIRGEQGVDISTIATDVSIAENASLTLPELIVVARNNINVENDAKILAENLSANEPSVTDLQLNVKGDGALLRVSVNEQVRVNRREESARPSEGFINLGQGVEINASKSIALDSSVDVVFQNDAALLKPKAELKLNGGDLTLGSSKVSIGDFTDLNSIAGVKFTKAELEAMDVNNLVLSSRNGIDLYGSIELNLNSIELDAGSINAYLNEGDVFAINAAEQITLSNASAYQAGDLNTNSAGKLQLASRNIHLANGAIKAAGISDLSLMASENIVVEGEGNFEFNNAGTVLLDGRITSASGANYAIDAKLANLLIQRSSENLLNTNEAVGGKLNISAGSLTHAGEIKMASGYLSLSSVGEGSDLILTEQSVINLSGFERDFAGQFVYTPGGALSLHSTSADIQVNEGALIDLSSTGNAGAIKLTAANGAININGMLQAASGDGYRSASFSSQSLTFDNLAGINQQLNTDFNQHRHIQIGAGDINLAENTSIIAKDVLLQTDNGLINVLGEIDASGDKGGRVYLAAQKADTLETDVLINLAGSIKANADDVSSEGGDVFIESRGNGLINVNGIIDVTGGVENRGGKITIRTPRTAANDDINLNSLAMDNLTGYRRLDIEGYKTYSINNVIDVTKFSLTGEYGAEANIFMQNAERINSQLGLAAQNNIHLKAGVELSSEGDITLGTGLDLQTLRFGAEAGGLSLRAKQSINLNASLQDGFDVLGNVHALQRGESWSFNLVSGADLNAASVNSISLNAVQASADIIQANITLANNALLRTGSGDINVLSAGDITMGTNAAIYTGGQRGKELSLYQEIAGRRGSFSFIDNQILSGLEFPENGGDVFIKSSGNLSAPQTSSLLVTDWLYRIGPNYISSPTEGELPNMIGVGFAAFTSGIGALGGGDIDIETGGSVNNVAVSVPTIEKYIGEVDVTVAGGRVSSYSLTESQTEVTGSGDINVLVGNNITQSLFFSANGNIDINAGGNIGDLTDDSGIYLVTGDTQANVFAAGDLNFQGVSTANLLPYSQKQKNLLNRADLTQFANYYSNFGENSAVALTALSGEIEIRNQAENVFSTVVDSGDYTGALSIYPGELTATAIDGSLNLKSNIRLYPSSSGGISLLAQNDITAFNSGSNTVIINMFDIAPEDLPSKLNSVTKENLLINPAEYQRSNRLLHIDDATPSRFVANTGDIWAVDLKNAFNIITNEQTELYAGRDIRGIDLSIQNTAENNISTLEAGRDIRHINGKQFGVPGVVNKIEINGPGELHVLAGRDINLGDQGGIVALANSVNPLLPSEGAELIVMAGLGEQSANYNGFIEYYFSEDAEYANTLLSFMKSKNSTLENFEQALVEFKLLDEKQQRSFILSAFSNELIQSATRAAKEQNNAPEVDDGELLGYTRGLNAIDVLFPGTIQSIDESVDGETTGDDLIVTGGKRYRVPDVNAAYRGNISMVASTIQTQGNEADISILAPGGFLNVGLSIADEGTQVEKGIITKGDGNVSLFTQGNIAVNQSRVQSLNQGFISGWSTKGNVDAGKGEKSALVIPPPRTVIDPESGALTQVFDVAVQGNGIRSACSDVDCLSAEEFELIAAQTDDVEYLNSLKRPGDVTLAAPAGVIDAGDAGIRSGGNLILATDTVLNANQISVGGDSTGVPVEAGALGVDLGGLDVNSASDDAASELVASDVSDQFGEGSIAILQVEVMGLSGESEIEPNNEPKKADEKDKLNKNSSNENINTKVRQDAQTGVEKNNKKISEKNAELTMNM